MKTPPDIWWIEEPQLLLIWRPGGVLDEAQVNRIVAFITEQENRFDKAFDRFTDLSVIDAVDLTFEYVFKVALHRRLVRLRRPSIKSAFFVTNPSIARYVKLHAVLTDHSPLQVAMFGEREAAAEWLGVAPEVLCPF